MFFNAQQDRPLALADLEPDMLYVWLQVIQNGLIMVSLFALEREPNPKGNLVILYRYDTGQH